MFFCPIEGKEKRIKIRVKAQIFMVFIGCAQRPFIGDRPAFRVSSSPEPVMIKVTKVHFLFSSPQLFVCQNRS